MNMGMFLGEARLNLTLPPGSPAAAPEAWIEWMSRVEQPNNVAIYVSVDGGPRAQTLRSGDASGRQSIAWIVPGHGYDFALVEITPEGQETNLATLHVDERGAVTSRDVTPSVPPAVEPPPPPATTDLLATLDQLPGGRWPWLAGGAALLFFVLRRRG